MVAIKAVYPRDYHIFVAGPIALTTSASRPLPLPKLGEEGGWGVVRGRKEHGMAIRDPVCEMVVDPNTAIIKSTFRKHTYYFCSPVCKALFEREPERYAPAQDSAEDGGGSAPRDRLH